jgi:hypothetical protein
VALQRIGTPSLSPDGAQAVAAVTATRMEDNRSASSLWLMSTLGGTPRALTTCGEQGRRAALEPARRPHRLHRQT